MTDHHQQQERLLYETGKTIELTDVGNMELPEEQVNATMANFSGFFGGALLVCIVVTFCSSDIYKQHFGKKATNKGEEGLPKEIVQKHHALLKKYLFVYLLATVSDWLQGPYVYALYIKYGFEQHEIAQLFVAGFGSSMIFGSFVGGMADWGGRRAFVVLFAGIYAASCITKRKFLLCGVVPNSSGIVLNRLLI